MNLIYISNAIVDSTKKIIELESLCGYKSLSTNKNLYLLCIIRELLNQADWYELSITQKQYLQDAYAKLLRDNKYFVFDFPTNTIYSNINNPQTSFTFDQIPI